MSASTRLQGKVAIITGGAGGIGCATAGLFCREGADVALVDLDEENLGRAAASVAEAAPRSRIVPVVADVAFLPDIERLVARVVNEFGRLNVLINNAAVREYYPLADAPEASWNRIVATNLLGVANCCRAALPHLRVAGGASIVNVSSIYAIVGRKGMGQYDATKAAILALTRALAVEEAPHGVRVNAVCPGSTLTPYTLGRAAARGMSEEELEARGAAPSLLNRWATPREIGFPILWLASDEASFMTGTAIVVDGGLSTI